MHRLYTSTPNICTSGSTATGPLGSLPSSFTFPRNKAIKNIVDVVFINIIACSVYRPIFLALKSFLLPPSLSSHTYRYINTRQIHVCIVFRRGCLTAAGSIGPPMAAVAALCTTRSAAAGIAERRKRSWGNNRHWHRYCCWHTVYDGGGTSSMS